MDDPYQLLATALAKSGIHCQFQSRGQLVISRQTGPVWPNRGNSFWVTHIKDRWHLFTWAPFGYRVPESADMVDLCRTCMAFGKSAMPEAPPEIVQAFKLVKLSDAEAEAVYREMDSPA